MMDGCVTTLFCVPCSMILHGLPLLGAPISGEDSRLVAAWDELPAESQRKILENLEILTSESSDEWVPSALIFQFLPLPTEVLSHLAICASLQWSIPKPKLFQYFWIGTVTFTSLWVPALQKMGSCQSTRHAVLQRRWYRYKMVQVHTSTSCFDSVNCAFFWGGRLKTCTIFCVFVPAFGKHFTELVCSTDRSRLRCHGFPGISCFLDHSLNDSKRKVPFAKRILYCLGMVGWTPEIRCLKTISDRLAPKPKKRQLRDQSAARENLAWPAVKKHVNTSSHQVCHGLKAQTMLWRLIVWFTWGSCVSYTWTGQWSWICLKDSKRKGIEAQQFIQNISGYMKT